MSSIESQLEELRQQIIDLQIHVSHQERTIHQLDEVIQQQHMEIDELKRLQQQLVDRLPQPSETAGFNLQDEKPPHY